ncbi:MAG: hypothetical protein OXU36_19665 [Candidatus Poribacteria bacterium]|nr:hypothetical protein [Candidatus Poribacteria bacterium]
MSNYVETVTKGNYRGRSWIIGWVIFGMVFVAGIARIIPVPHFSFGMREPIWGNDAAYQRTFRVDYKEELHVVFFGSSVCAASNDEELPEMIDAIKKEMLRHAIDMDLGFNAVGVAIDWYNEDGINYLRKYGAFDEIVAGRKWHGLGARTFMKENIVGQTFTPQVLIYLRESASSEGEDLNSQLPRNTILVRKIGKQEIDIWIETGMGIPWYRVDLSRSQDQER